METDKSINNKYVLTEVMDLANFLIKSVFNPWGETEYKVCF